ncbi:MAG TPA: 2Fe-2S iron-sulfur cluster binding domain-containing protein [Methylomirabilota bacterium]|jgi:toluene monooxygenase electron transfer component|nr:2Fe-2S iron-sulfur cluster binding domain-containing protein [Methylomirabilota bacterium]
MKVVVSAKNGTRDFECAPGEKILHAGLRGGVELPYECATGTCGTCKARLVTGRTESEWPDAPGKKYFRLEGDFLTCQSVAHGDCALEVGGTLKTREPNTSAPASYGGVVRGLQRLTHDVVAFDVDLDARLDFAAGQFALITVPGITGARAYSMVNFERGAARLGFVVKKKPGGAVSEWLFGEAADGARLRLFAPLGHATFHPDVRKHVLCIAGGSGIAGMMSILALACGESHFAAWDGHVFFGVRTARDGFFLDELEAFRAKFPARLAMTVALSDEDVPGTLAAAYPGFGFARGFVHAVAGEAMKGRYADLRAYVAGPPPMVDASLRLLLREARLPPADIRYDKFS